MDTHGPPPTPLAPSGLVAPAPPSSPACATSASIQVPRVVYAIEVTPYDAGKTLKGGATTPNGQQLFLVIGQIEVSAALRFEEVLQRIEALTRLNLDEYDVVYRKRLYGHPWNSSLPIESQKAHDAFVSEALRVKADAPIMVRLLRRHHGQHGQEHYHGPQTPQHTPQQPSSRYTQPQQSNSSRKSNSGNNSSKSRQTPTAASPKAPSSVELVILIRVVQGREIQRLNSPGFIGPLDQRHLHSSHYRTMRPIFDTTTAAAADKVTRFSIKASHAFSVLREQMTAEVRRLLNDRQLKLSNFHMTFSPSEGFNNFHKSIVIDSPTKYRSFVDEVLMKSRWGRPLIEVQLRWKGAEWVTSPTSNSREHVSRSESHKWGVSSGRERHKSNTDSVARGERFGSVSPIGAQDSEQSLRSFPSTPRLPTDREGNTNALSKRGRAEDETSECRGSRSEKRRRRSTTSPFAARESSTTRSSAAEEGEHSEAGNIGTIGTADIILPDGPYISISEFMQNHRPGYDALVEKLHKQGIRDMPHLAACQTTGLLKGQQRRKDEDALSLIDCVCIATWLRLWREMEPKTKKEAQDF
ncbi:hypothetical protein BCV69DRAFT_25684 [Microstroma glucosiphilum]|uniref:Uncharacterized protein n=1 Tax=Pseudomicrostroma glucosiphilum TaxID=1684307 RepID=A0A316UGB8_9BASI|nr:hypothetical protein BCV69DRAFT_25684 [Pseudomicrostroma glucosiphilum]PWN24306.1 hypothetical protein BCV69DRAFT_25684 [Pseudomicrostroma glucosiphilum]